jgi:hypothetical protein
MLSATFWILIGVFGVIASMFFIPAVRELLKGPFFISLWIIFFLLGVALIFLTVKKKVKGMLKKFLILTGVFAVGFFVFAFLHNVVYGLFIQLFGPDFWDRIGLTDEPFFFFLAVVVCPIGFLIGVVGSIALFIRRRQKSFSLPFIAFLQAAGLVVYCGLVGLLMWRGERWFGPPYTFLGPVFFLVLFVASALISALIVLGYPFILFWEKKQTFKALKLVVCTSAWLIFFAFLIIFLLVIF